MDKASKLTVTIKPVIPLEYAAVIRVALRALNNLHGTTRYIGQGEYTIDFDPEIDARCNAVLEWLDSLDKELADDWPPLPNLEGIDMFSQHEITGDGNE